MIVSSTKFDIELVVLVAHLISTALFATELTCSALLGPFGPGALIATAHAARFVALQIGQALLSILAFDGITCGGFNTPSPVGNWNGPTGEAGLPLELADVPIGDPIGSTDYSLCRRRRRPGVHRWAVHRTGHTVRRGVLILDAMFTVRALDEPAGCLTMSLVGHHEGCARLPTGPLLQLTLGFVRFAIGATNGVVESRVLRNFIAKVEITSTHSTPAILWHVEHLLQM